MEYHLRGGHFTETRVENIRKGFREVLEKGDEISTQRLKQLLSTNGELDNAKLDEFLQITAYDTGVPPFVE